MGPWKGFTNTSTSSKGKMKEKVEANKELAFLSRELATIVVDIDFAEDFAAMAMEPADASALAPVLEELEFRTLAKRLLGEAFTATSSRPASTLVASVASAPAAASDSSDDGQLSMFDAALDVAPSASTLMPWTRKRPTMPSWTTRRP